jgi:hypothetical protein
MTKLIEVPYVGALLIVDELPHLQLLNRSDAVRRPLSEEGSLLMRFLHKRLFSDLRFAGHVLPALLDRDNRSREYHQAAVEALLPDYRAQGRVSDEDLAPLFAFVAGKLDANAAAIATQQVLGRWFQPGYKATQKTLDAAKRVDKWTMPLPRLGMSALERAKALLYKTAGEDVRGLHATAVTVHHVIDALERMRDLAKSSAGATDIHAPELLEKVLRPPPTLLRICERQESFPFVDRPLPAGTVILIRMAKIHDKSAEARKQGTDTVFLEDEWSRCPARNGVRSLLVRVWEAQQVTQDGVQPAADVVREPTVDRAPVTIDAPHAKGRKRPRAAGQSGTHPAGRG